MIYFENFSDGRRPSLTFNEIYSNVDKEDYYQKKTKKDQNPVEPNTKTVFPEKSSPKLAKKKKLTSAFFARIREIKNLESQLKKSIKENKSAVKGTAQAVTKKDYPLRKPATIDCGNCLECSQIKKDIDVPARNRQFIIKKIINLYAQANYALRKKEYEVVHGKKNVKETLMYHGTKLACAKPIIKNNFNWRLFGKFHGCVFGQGTSFTIASEIAEIYCDQRADVRCIIVSKVLAARASFGDRNTVFPKTMDRTKMCDTSISPRKTDKVIVKYRDDEFLPSHVVYFTDTDMDKYNFYSTIENEGRDFVS